MTSIILMEEEKHIQEKSSDSHADASGCSLPVRHQRSGCCPDRFHYRSDYEPVDHSVDHSVDHPVRHTHPGQAGVMAAMAEFLGIFALTQIPLAVVEGILSAIVVMMLESFAKPELREIGFIPKETV